MDIPDGPTGLADAPTVVGSARGMALGGDAVFALEDRRVVFVPHGAPGDVAQLRLRGALRGVLRGQLAILEQPGPGRVEPPCPFFHAGCGGCQWQQLGYATQLEQKQNILRETLRRLGKITAPMLEPLAAPEAWRYRTAIQLQVDDEGQVAFAAAHSHDLVPISACLIAHPLLNRLIAALSEPLPRAILRDRTAAITGISARVAATEGRDRLLLLIHSGGGRARSARRLVEAIRGPVPEIGGATLLATPEPEAGRRAAYPTLQRLEGEAYLPTEVGGARYYVSPLAFFQVNAALTERLVEIVREVVAAERPARVLDLYCGVGLFALAVADLAAEVTGYEAETEAFHLAEQGREYLALTQGESAASGVRFIRRTVESLQAEDLTSAGVVILDPPRAGLPGRLIDSLIAAAPRCLVYVSCEPSSLARDLSRLTGAGWRLESVQLLDMFPQTYHIESISVLRRDPAGPARKRAGHDDKAP